MVAEAGVKMKTHWSNKLVDMGACRDAVTWAREQPSLEAAWRDCHRADWMLWLLRHSNVLNKDNVRVFISIACDCAESVVHLAQPDSQLACLWAIDAARRNEDIEEIRAARSAAYAADDAAAADAAAYAADADAADDDAAAYAAAAAAYAAAAYAADAAAYAAADAAAYAADAADDAAAERSKQADIVRGYFPQFPKEL